jgi:hypothetical protein
MVKLDKFVDFLNVVNHVKFYLREMNILRPAGSRKGGFCLSIAYGSHNIALRFRADK